MYRKSDVNCTGPDAAPFKERYIPHKEKWDTLSQESSRKVMLTLNKIRSGGHGTDLFGSFIIANLQDSQRISGIKFPEISMTCPEFSNIGDFHDGFLYGSAEMFLFIP